MKSIQFKPEMIRAILDGRKTMTRRVVNPQPDSRGLRTTNVAYEDWHGTECKPKYKVGDNVYVKEPFIETYSTDDKIHYEYKADYSEIMADEVAWKSPLFMPERASRIFLEITDVRTERLQDISQEDAMSEGITLPNYAEEAIKDVKYPDPYEIFMELWNSINAKKHPWESNPWVFVYEFENVTDKTQMKNGLTTDEIKVIAKFNDSFKTSAEWSKEAGYTVLDPDGWDRTNYDYSFNKELITFEEFSKRILKSTVIRRA